MSQKIEAIARKNGFKGFTATVLARNPSMLHVFHKRYPNAVITKEMGEVRVQMDFGE